MRSFFTDSFSRFEPDAIRWPDLSPEALSRLRSLPIWEEAVRTEASTALKVQIYARKVKDADLKEAIAMNGYEEARHARMLKLLTRRYDIAVPAFEFQPEGDPEWAFMRVGYGECFDSFFGFGLFALAKESGFFPQALCDLFDPIMQEEARHIIFHVNWVSYTQAQEAALGRAGCVFNRALALALQAAGRIKTAMALSGGGAQEHFTMAAGRQFGDVSPRRFLETCLRENDRRLAPYDPRLLRPQAVPAMARAALLLMPGGSA